MYKHIQYIGWKPKAIKQHCILYTEIVFQVQNAIIHLFTKLWLLSKQQILATTDIIIKTWDHNRKTEMKTTVWYYTTSAKKRHLCVIYEEKTYVQFN